MTKGLRFSGNDDLSTAQDAAPVLIICVGSKIQFPDCLFRMIAAEIEGSSYLRLPAPVDLAAAIEDGDLRPQLVIVDDSLWDQMDAALLNGIRMDLRAAVAIAFRDVRCLADLMAGRAGLPKGISFLPMDLNIESWLTIVRLMLTGYPFVPSEFLLAMEGFSQHTPQPSPPEVALTVADALDKLTPREREVLALVAEGFQNKHIAERLDLSEHTVKLHLHHVISKLGARNRTDAALRYRHSMVS